MNSEFLSSLNWLHIVVATVAYFMLGAVWYSFLFQKKWVEYQKIDMSNPSARTGVGFIMALSFVGFLIICTGLAILSAKMNLEYGASSGVKLGLTTGVCFSAAAISITYLYVKKPLGLHFIDGLYHIVGQVIAAVILCAWK